ncbi:MAG TPA: type II toxin-antitoxin system VapC family toxin [Gammaproteobacteria bacterium]|jgi:PIN domain nuclease of toxin-antitoxin system|nr:type II toxin-antitoxin system VapC family toxin [Gammaproteobacteria bacterium]
MEYLLDTHILLWWLSTPNTIHAKARRIIQDSTNVIYVSSASFWEMAIKKSIGRLTLPHNLMEAIARQHFKILPILAEECLGVADLPMIHTDPFDRMLVIQAKLQNLVIITRDNKIPEYPVVTISG